MKRLLQKNQTTQKIQKTQVALLLLIFPIIIVAKIYQFTALNRYAFGIINRLIGWLPTSYIPSDNSYGFPLRIYRAISFLPLKTTLEWGIFWAIIMNVVFFFILLKIKKKYTAKEYLFIYASMFILDVFVFNINKDLIQCILALIPFAIFRTKIKNKYKIILAALLMGIESVVFRPYYIIFSASIVVSYVVLKKKVSKDNRKTVAKYLLLYIAVMLTAMYLAQYVSKSGYNALISRRDTLAEDLDSATVITNVVGGNSFFAFALNYIINAARMMFPLELLFMGVKYAPFVAYQLYLTLSIISAIKNKLNHDNLAFIAFILGYWIMLVASESDFGTMIRHQSILLPFYVTVISSAKIANSKRKIIAERGNK